MAQKQKINDKYEYYRMTKTVGRKLNQFGKEVPVKNSLQAKQRKKLRASIWLT